MTLGTLLVLLGLVLAVIACFSDRLVGRVQSLALPVAVVLVALGVLLGAGALIKV